MIYLDNAATTYPKPEEVYIALDKANRNAFNTGRGSYKCAREASETKEAVRNKILNINKIKNAKVVYTNSATTSLNDLIIMINRYKENDSWRETIAINEEEWKHIQDIMIASGELNEYVPYDKLIYGKYFKEFE